MRIQQEESTFATFKKVCIDYCIQKAKTDFLLDEIQKDFQTAKDKLCSILHETKVTINNCRLDIKVAAVRIF